MQKLKFLHFGDLHLDMPFTSLGNEGVYSTIRRQELRECFDKIIEIAQHEEVDVIFISGDLFEYSYVRKSTINHINENFKKIKDIKVFIVPGNHDPFLPDSYYKNYSWSENVHILAGSRESIKLEEYGTCIYGAGFGSFYEKESLVSEMKAEDRNLINILLVHGTVDMTIGNGDYNPMTTMELEATGMDYIALGHFHNRMEGLGKTGIIYNPGSPEPLGFDEPGEHGVFVGAIQKEEQKKADIDVRFVKVSKRCYETLEIDAGGCSLNEQLVDRMSKVLYSKDINSCLFDVRFKGYVNKGFVPDIAYIYRFFEDKLFYLKLRDDTEEDFNISEIAEEPGIRGVFVRKLLSLIKAEKDEVKRKLYREAMHFGLQALENEEIEIF